MALLHLARKIRGAPVLATDGEIGAVEDFYFQEDGWTVRYVLVDTGRWVSGKHVLVSPMSVTERWGRGGLHVKLTRDQVWHSPQIDTSTLSRAQEEDVLKHYGHPIYWGAGGVWGSFESPAALLAAPLPPPPPPEGPVVDVEAEHLRSVNASTGYHLHARDGDIGHVDDFVIGEETWRIRYLLVDTSNWIGGKWVIVRTDLVRGVDREQAMLNIDATRDEIRKSPSFASIEEAVGPDEVGPPFVIL